MNIYESITKIMEEGYAITKSKRNQQQGFMYRGIDDVMNTFHPLLSKYHVFVVPEVIDQQRQERVTGQNKTLIYSILRIKYTFFAEDGSSINAIVVGEGMDSGDKASNKAMSVGMKYAMFQVFCIPTEEMDDPDAVTPPPTKPAPAEPAEQALTGASPESKTLYVCGECGSVIMPYKGKNGGTVEPETHAQASMKKFGQVLCLHCIGKRTHENAS